MLRFEVFAMNTCTLPQLTGSMMSPVPYTLITPWKINMEPENHLFVEEASFPVWSIFRIHVNLQGQMKGTLYSINPGTQSRLILNPGTLVEGTLSSKAPPPGLARQVMWPPAHRNLRAPTAAAVAGPAGSSTSWPAQAGKQVAPSDWFGQVELTSPDQFTSRNHRLP